MKQQIKAITVTKLSSSSSLDHTYQYICDSRKNSNCTNSIWDLRFYWKLEKIRLRAELQQGTYNFHPFKLILYLGHKLTRCHAKDAVVLKALQLQLSGYLNYIIPKTCASIKGRGGIKAAIRKAASWSEKYQYYYKSDIKGYYKSINHEALYLQLFKKITDRKLQILIKKYCENLIDRDGVLETQPIGIIKGGALSPLLGNFYLSPLDLAMQKIKQIRYVRYMDDWLIVANTRHHLRRAIKKAHQVLAELKLQIAKEKTSMGKMSKVFSFLGYQIGAKKLQVSFDSQKRASEKLVRLIEPCASRKRIEQYLTRWHIWAQAGLSACVIKLELPSWITKLLDLIKV